MVTLNGPDVKLALAKSEKANVLLEASNDVRLPDEAGVHLGTVEPVKHSEFLELPAKSNRIYTFNAGSPEAIQTATA